MICLLLTSAVGFQMTWDRLFISLGAVYLLASFYKCRSRTYCCRKHIDFLWGPCRFRYLEKISGFLQDPFAGVDNGAQSSTARAKQDSGLLMSAVVLLLTWENPGLHPGFFS